MPMSLRERRREPEVMDQPGLDESRHRHALTGLARINRISGSTGILWTSLRELVRRSRPNSPVRILDVATGGGDLPIALWRRFRRLGVAVHIAGCDRSPAAVEFAQQQARSANADVAFFVADALRDPLPAGYDAVICSLFLHHLDEPEARELLQRMSESAQRLVAVNDLRRSTTGWLLARYGTQILTRSPVVHVDAPLSVQAAFTVNEVRGLAGQAGLAGATVVRRWPWRFLLTWWKPAA